jgi:hypothetical protein
VITIAPAVQRGGDDTIESVDLTGNQSLIDAVAPAGVRQIIFVSTIASDPKSPAPIFRAKGAAEARLRESGNGTPARLSVLVSAATDGIGRRIIVGMTAIIKDRFTIRTVECVLEWEEMAGLRSLSHCAWSVSSCGPGTLTRRPWSGVRGFFARIMPRIYALVGRNVQGMSP